MLDGTDTVPNDDLDSFIDWSLEDESGENTEEADEEPEADAEGDDTPTESDDEGGEEVESEESEEGDDDDDRFVVKVNGEEREVTLQELVQGFQLHSDYTQKTQALAREREELAALRTLADAIASDPIGTVSAMAERFGVKLASEVDTTLNGTPLDPDDPVEGELLRLRQQNAEMERRISQAETQRQSASEDQRKAEVLSEIEDIKARYADPDLDPGALLRFAVENEVGNLDIAYQAMKAQAPEPPTIRRIKAKREAPPVEGGAHRAGVKDGAPNRRMSLEDALDEAINSI